MVANKGSIEMTKGKRIGILLGASVLALGIGFKVTAAQGSPDSYRVASLVNEMEGVTPAALEQMQPIAVKSQTLPGPSVDVMRVRLQETYSVEGVGKDTVELTGWIAVRHGASRPAPGFQTVSWRTAVTDTEFVGLELDGHSNVFGPVHVSLDSSRPAIGQVGAINVPERASKVLLVANKSTQAAPDTTTTDPKPAAPQTAQPCPDGTEATAAAACNCRAPVNVKISMSQLNLQMKTKEPAIWYSKVTTIPPVGHVASVTVDPVALMSADRQVGSLVSGVVKFREVVRSVSLSKDHQITVASMGGAPTR